MIKNIDNVIKDKLTGMDVSDKLETIDNSTSLIVKMNDNLIDAKKNRQRCKKRLEKTEVIDKTNKMISGKKFENR